jgi:hypothetical protein
MTFVIDQPGTGSVRAFWLALVLNVIWINASEIFRYFVFVMPMMRELLPQVPNIAPMNVPVFLVWGAWDTILVIAATAVPWLVAQRYGRSPLVALCAGTFLWMAVFVILWLALFNMSLADLRVVSVALPLSWIELAVAAQIVALAMRRWDA